LGAQDNRAFLFEGDWEPTNDVIDRVHNEVLWRLAGLDTLDERDALDLDAHSRRFTLGDLIRPDLVCQQPERLDAHFEPYREPSKLKDLVSFA